VYVWSNGEAAAIPSKAPSTGTLRTSAQTAMRKIPSPLQMVSGRGEYGVLEPDLQADANATNGGHAAQTTPEFAKRFEGSVRIPRN